jgi:hypothetical protein
VLIAVAWLAALAAYPVGSLLVRLFVTVATLPLVGLVRDASSIALVRATRVIGGGVCGVGGFALAWWAHGLFGVRASLILAVVLVVLVALAHGRGLRRLAGGPQLAEEAFSFAGEELGLLAAVAWLVLA